MPQSYVYIMSNKWLTTLYIGVTSNLERRVLEHKLGEGSKFTEKYKLDRLIYFEYGESIMDAIAREKQLKSWRREWKWDLIKQMNPELRDLSEGWYEEQLLKR
jgi:putative endonuclease